MRFPVFWLAAAYAGGLAAFAEVDDSPRVLFWLAALALLAGFAALGRRWLGPALAAALLGAFLLGGATLGLADAAVEDTRLDKLVDSGQVDLSEAVRLVGWLRRAPERKPFATTYELEVESLEAGGRVWPTSGGVLLSYFPPPAEAPTPAPPLPALAYGDRVETLVRVHRPVNHLNLGGFDWRTYLGLLDIYLEGSLKDPALLTKLPGTRGDRFFAAIERLRLHLLERLDALVPPDTQGDRNAVLRAMLLGDRGFLSHRLAEQFRLSGVYHVLVISGLHVGIIALFVFWLLRRLGGPEGIATVATVALLVFYLLLVEDRPPIERAVWMVAIYLAARLLFRQVHLANTTAVAALLVLFLHPYWVFQSSFHLSFVAVFMIAFFALPWIERSSAPYREALSFLDSPERAERQREPRLAQFRLDLRALAELVSGLAFWSQEKERVTLRLLARAVRLGLRAWDFFLLSFAIQMGFVLLSAVYFNRVVWTGLLANVLVVPLVGWIVPLGLGALLVGLVWPLAGKLLALPASLLLGGLLGIVKWLGRPGLSYGVSPPPLFVTLLYLAALAGLALAVARRKHQRWAGAALAVIALLVVTHPFPAALDRTALEVTVLDVGQGDSLFVSFPNRETWLIDGGRGPVPGPDGYRIGEAIGETVVVPYLRARGLERLDRVWLTHAHHDHMSGLTAVVQELPVGSFDIGPSPTSPPYQELLDNVRARGIPLRAHVAGERFTVDGVEVEILWPDRDYHPGRTPDNNDSLVLRLCPPAQAGQAPACVLLPGDIEADVERKLAASGAPLAAAVLKVPHHGGRGAAGAEFLAAVSPQVAVVSAGATNPFGHPFPDVLERLRGQGAQVYRTDRDGSVTVRVRNGSLEASSYRERQRRVPYASLWARAVACARRLLSLESE